jgi:hypothetical protein
MAPPPAATLRPSTRGQRALAGRGLAASPDRGRREEEEDGGGPSPVELRAGDKIQVEVLSFGPLGASVEIVALGHDPDDVPAAEPESGGGFGGQGAIGRGLVLQREIGYFRQARNNVDVVRGEILPAYVERVRDDGSVDVSLRSYGGRAKVRLLCAGKPRGARTCGPELRCDASRSLPPFSLVLLRSPLPDGPVGGRGLQDPGEARLDVRGRAPDWRQVDAGRNSK